MEAAVREPADPLSESVRADVPPPAELTPELSEGECAAPTLSLPVAPPGSAAQWLANHADKAWSFDYYAVMRRLEGLALEAPRWGRALRPSAEVVRVGQEPSMSFAPSVISRFLPASAHRPPMLRQHFIGYIGANGPLPIHLSEFIRERALHHADPTWLSFLDIFAHRFALHSYRAWSQARPVTGMDRPGDDHFRHQIGAFVGIGGVARQARDEVPDDARLHFSGWLSRRVRNAEGVEAVVARYFGVPARLEPWVGHWMRLPAGERSGLGMSAGAEASRALGRGAVLGGQVWDRQHRVRLHLGPLTRAQYEQFLPIGDAQPVLSCWMQQLLGDERVWDAELVLRADEVPPTHLGSPRKSEAAEASQAKAGVGARLGWTSWLGERPRSRDARDVRISAGVRMAHLGAAEQHQETYAERKKSGAFLQSAPP